MFSSELIDAAVQERAKLCIAAESLIAAMVEIPRSPHLPAQINKAASACWSAQRLAQVRSMHPITTVALDLFKVAICT